MADQQHLDLLCQEQNVWNIWRKQHPEIRPDLSGADLSGADLDYTNLSGADLTSANLSSANLHRIDLSGANLSGANLSGADLTGADLGGADLSNANLSTSTPWRANLSSANLSSADLSGADLHHTNLREANLREANLTNADLRFTDLIFADLRGAFLFDANFSSADLNGANLSNAKADYTHFDNIDLHTVKGLERVEHRGPSHISIETIYRSQGRISEVFLRQAGVPEDFIIYMHSLIGHPIEYYTCFISYSSRDQEFADRLYADLQSKGVRCWFAPEDMKTGDKIRQRIDESIHLYDKLLLVLSEHSIASSWVEFEVETALAKEDEKHPRVLFPIRLDDAVMQCTTSWAAHIKRMRHITNFTGWKQHDDYQKALTRLFRDLKATTPTEGEYNLTEASNTPPETSLQATRARRDTVGSA